MVEMRILPCYTIDGNRPFDNRGKKKKKKKTTTGRLMARVMLVIRKIVDREAYNRANIIDPIPAITYRTNQPIFPSPLPFS